LKEVGPCNVVKRNHNAAINSPPVMMATLGHTEFVGTERERMLTILGSIVRAALDPPLAPSTLTG
jgi:hypothetical protein